MVLNVLGDTIDFIFGLMDLDLWICCWDSVNLSIDFLLFENWSFSDTDSKFSFAIASVRRNDFLSELVFFDHEFEVDINIFARCHVVCLFLLFFLFCFFHLDPSLFPFLLNFLNGLHGTVVFRVSLYNLNKKKFICILQTYFLYFFLLNGLNLVTSIDGIIFLL